MQLRSREGSSGSQKGEDVMEFQKSRGEQEQAQEQRQQRVKHRATVDAVAGAVAGGVSRTVVSPLDVIKIRFQVRFLAFFLLLSFVSFIFACSIAGNSLLF